MKTYSIAVFTGDLINPLKRIKKASLEDLDRYLSGYPQDQICSAIIHKINTKGNILTTGVFFGTKQILLSQEESKNML